MILPLCSSVVRGKLGTMPVTALVGLPRFDEDLVVFWPLCLPVTGASSHEAALLVSRVNE